MRRCSAKEEIIWVFDGNSGDSMRKYFNSEHGLKMCPLIKFLDETMVRGVMTTKIIGKLSMKN